MIAVIKLCVSYSACISLYKRATGIIVKSCGNLYNEIQTSRGHCVCCHSAGNLLRSDNEVRRLSMVLVCFSSVCFRKYPGILVLLTSSPKTEMHEYFKSSTRPEINNISTVDEMVQRNSKFFVTFTTVMGLLSHFTDNVTLLSFIRCAIYIL